MCSSQITISRIPALKFSTGDALSVNQPLLYVCQCSCLGSLPRHPVYGRNSLINCDDNSNLEMCLRLTSHNIYKLQTTISCFCITSLFSRLIQVRTHPQKVSQTVFLQAEFPSVVQPTISKH